MKRLFAIPILFFLSFVFAMYCLYPAYSHFGNLKKEISRKKTEIEKKEEELASLKNISKSLEGEKESLDKINSGLPDDFSIASLINFLQEKAGENGLILKSITESSLGRNGNQEGKMPLANLKEFFFDINLIGTFPAFENFIRSLERSSRIIEVENVSFKESKDLLEMVLQIKVYSYK